MHEREIRAIRVSASEADGGNGNTADIEQRGQRPYQVYERHCKADCTECIGTDTVADEHSVHDREDKKAEIADHSRNDIFTQIFSLFCHCKTPMKQSSESEKRRNAYYSPFSDSCQALFRET